MINAVAETQLSIPNARGRKNAASRLRASSGFTLVEVAVAAFVMLIAVSSSLLILQRGLQGVDVARNSTLAAQIMQSEIERIRLMSWNDIMNPAKLPTPNADVDISAFVAADPKIAQRFSVKRTVTPVTGRETSMVTVTVDVTWANVDNTPHTRSFSTRYSKDGLYDYYYTIAH